MINGLIVRPDGNKFWYQDDLLHRVDEPAIIWANGSKFWYQHGKRHRFDGPAIEFANGEKLWYLNGEQIHCNTNEEFLRIVKLKAFW